MEFGLYGLIALGKMGFKLLTGVFYHCEWGKNVKNGDYGFNSFNEIDISPSGPSLYLTKIWLLYKDAQ